jgi:hypothetical protein
MTELFLCFQKKKTRRAHFSSALIADPSIHVCVPLVTLGDLTLSCVVALPVFSLSLATRPTHHGTRRRTPLRHEWPQLCFTFTRVPTVPSLAETPSRWLFFPRQGTETHRPSRLPLSPDALCSPLSVSLSR